MTKNVSVSASVSVYAFGRVSILQRWSQYTEKTHTKTADEVTPWALHDTHAGSELMQQLILV